MCSKFEIVFPETCVSEISIGFEAGENSKVLLDVTLKTSPSAPRKLSSTSFNSRTENILSPLLSLIVKSLPEVL